MQEGSGLTHSGLSDINRTSAKTQEPSLFLPCQRLLGATSSLMAPSWLLWPCESQVPPWLPAKRGWCLSHNLTIVLMGGFQRGLETQDLLLLNLLPFHSWQGLYVHCKERLRAAAGPHLWLPQGHAWL